MIAVSLAEGFREVAAGGVFEGVGGASGRRCGGGARGASGKVGGEECWGGFGEGDGEGGGCGEGWCERWGTRGVLGDSGEIGRVIGEKGGRL